MKNISLQKHIFLFLTTQPPTLHKNSISITLASQVTNQHNCIHLFLSCSYCIEFPLQKLYSNKIKIMALSPLDDTQKSHLERRRTDSHLMSIMQSHFISFITVSEENIHSRPCNKECHYHFNWFNTFIQMKTFNTSTQCYRHTILHCCINSKRSPVTVNILVLCS